MRGFHVKLAVYFSPERADGLRVTNCCYCNICLSKYLRSFYDFFFPPAAEKIISILCVFVCERVCRPQVYPTFDIKSCGSVCLEA